jgi:hypothetical protein
MGYHALASGGVWQGACRRRDVLTHMVDTGRCWDRDGDGRVGENEFQE